MIIGVTFAVNLLLAILLARRQNYAESTRRDLHSLAMNSELN